MQKLQSRLRGKQRAFTLIELLVVILIIAILIAVAAPSLLGQQNKAHDSATKQALTVAYKTAKAESVDNDPQGAYGSDSDVRAALAQSEPQLHVAASDTPATGEVAVCADTSATQLHLASLSKSGKSYSLTAPANHKQTITEGTCSGAASGEPVLFDSSTDARCGGLGVGRQTEDLLTISVGSAVGLLGKLPASSGGQGLGQTSGYFRVGGGNPASLPYATMPTSTCYTRATSFSYHSGYLTTANGLYLMARNTSTIPASDSFIRIPSGASDVQVDADGLVSYYLSGSRHDTVSITLATFSLGTYEYDDEDNQVTVTWTEDELFTDIGEGLLTQDRSPENVTQPNNGWDAEAIVGP
jgi:type IV pilus assembly protein PilA